MTYLEKIAERAASMHLGSIPDAVQDKLKASLLYTLVMALTGHDPADHFWAGLLRAHPSAPQSTLLVDGRPFSMADAAFLNAALACVRGQNDTFTEAVAHPGCVAIPAVLAVAQHRGATGAQVLEALAAGYETLASIAAPISSAVVSRGFRATSVFGVFVSAAAVARLLQLDVRQTAHALAIATQQAAGTMQCWEEGTPEWRIQVGQASRAGVFAALAAAEGCTASKHALEGRSGFYRCFAGMVPEALETSAWRSLDLVFKPYPGCLINQGPLHLLQTLMRREHLAGSDIRSVIVHLPPQNANYPGVASHGPFPDRTGAVMSAPFMLEMLLRNGTLRHHDFDRHYGPDPLHAASGRIMVREEAALPTWGNRLVLEANDGRLWEGRHDDQSCFAFGWDEVTALLDLVVGEWPFADSMHRYSELRHRIAGIAAEPDVRRLMTLCTA
ncbi:MmgE/PrpD family protein [Ottowia sp. VDI28]|uniref:MmgE/PrpD family protein n=1 Tax=Ottowia sp. VDI28 TaxID=3133968 RepID=UPI003C2B6CDD